MLFWLFVIVLVVGIALIILDSNFIYSDCLDVIGLFTSIISGAVLLIMVICLIGDYTSADATLQQNRERYNALTYKVESGSCRDEFGLLNKEIIDEIQEWNEDVVYKKEIQNNFWVGIFYPDIYDEFETIEYERYVKD